MRKVLIWVVLGLALLWGGYWFVGAHLIERQLDAWVKSERAAGNRAEFSVLRVQGFPSRFDIHAEGVDLYSPARGWGWKAPIAELAALSYQPQHYIAVLPHSQQLETPLGAVEIESADLRASLVFVPGPSFVLDRSSLIARQLALHRVTAAGTGAGEPPAALLAIDELRLASRRATGDRMGHRIGLELTGLSVSPALLAALHRTDGTGATSAGPSGEAAALLQTLGRAQAHLYVDAVLDFDRRLDRHALSGEPPQPTRLRLDRLSAEWGPLALSLQGELQIDAQGVPQGTLAAQLDGIGQMLDLAEGAGLVNAAGRRLIEGALRVAGAAAGGTPADAAVANDETGAEGALRVSLTFRDGLVLLGAIPLGAAPRLRLR